MKLKHILPLLLVVLLPQATFADLNLTAYYMDKSGVEITTTEDFTAEAPLHVRFEANPASLPTTAQLEWHIRNTATGSNHPRYDTDVVEFDFSEAGLTEVTVQVRDDDVVLESATLRITISESHLEMPNAFSPNGDGINDRYQAKSNSKSIVEFHAYIFNRYGQKLYEWTDWQNRDGGWDGTYHGHPVKDGVYYVYVKARGADGLEYNIRRDVNLLRSFNTVETTAAP